MIVAIHQPNFFPWLGYFDKIKRADAFVLLDHVQFQKTGGTWTNRVKLLINGEPRWVTAPVDRAFHGVRPINEIRFNESVPWRAKMLKTLEASYRKTPFFSEAIDLLQPQILRSERELASYNIEALTAIAAPMGLQVGKFVRSSALAISGQGTELLISIIRAVGGGTYLCGGGANGYQQDEILEDAGIRVVYQNFRHPVYPQAGTTAFLPGLSVIDALLNLGVEGTKRLILRHK